MKGKIESDEIKFKYLSNITYNTNQPARLSPNLLSKTWKISILCPSNFTVFKTISVKNFNKVLSKIKYWVVMVIKSALGEKKTY